MKLSKIVAQNIRGFRKMRGMSQEELAVKSDIATNYLACVERDEVGIALARIEKIAKTLKIEPYLLLVKGAAENWK